MCRIMLHQDLVCVPLGRLSAVQDNMQVHKYTYDDSSIHLSCTNSELFLEFLSVQNIMDVAFQSESGFVCLTHLTPTQVPSNMDAREAIVFRLTGALVLRSKNPQHWTARLEANFTKPTQNCLASQLIHPVAKRNGLFK